MDRKYFTEEQLRHFNSTDWRYLKVHHDEYELEITLSRPEKRNAFTPLMVDEIAFALAYANTSDRIRCVVIRGEGPVFCAGADLMAFHDPTIDGTARSVPVPLQQVTLGDAFAGLYKPCVAQVEGAVLAGGFLIIAGCTFVYSIPEAGFGLPEVKRGLWPMQVMGALMAVVSPRKILEMCITGKSYTAQEACQMGLVTHLSGRENIQGDVRAMVETICGNAPLAIRNGIRAQRKLTTLPESEKYSWLREQLEVLVQSADAREGIAAFKEKRAPDWENR